MPASAWRSLPTRSWSRVADSSYQVAQLESRGWTIRERFVDDERGVVARITPAGERMRRRVFAGHVEIVRSAFLDAVEPGELATLTAVLDVSRGGSDRSIGAGGRSADGTDTLRSASSALRHLAA